MLRYLQDFLLGISATDRELLHELEGGNPTAHSTQVRAILGAVILSTFVTTWASTARLATTFGVSVYVGTAIGLLAGLIKLVWDRRVAAAANRKVAVFRMFVAIPISALMALPLALSVFGDYATETSKMGERQTITSTYEENLGERKALEAEVDSLRRAESFFQTMVETEQGGLTQREAGITDEQLKRYGVEAPSGRQGCGRRCEAYQQRAQGYQSALGAKEKQLSDLPTREELKARRDSALDELEQETTGGVTRISALYEKGFERPFIFVLFGGLMLVYAFVDLLPALERVFSADLYTKEQLARIKAKERKRAIERAQEQGELRKTRAATWMEAIIITRILEEADSGDVPLERLKELAGKLDELEAPQEDSSPEDPSEESSGQEQQPTDGAGGNLRREGMSGGYLDLRPGASAGDGAPSAEEESDRSEAPRPQASRSDVPRVNGRLLLPPANGRESS
jgi:hypothetical protein